ncbi:MAG: hypothetical protein HY817_03765 [Candidatus Abawacabacteria bacterium]|nr:hypothetical protein [Candidatus Abawacabacteria bacterium]
MLQNKLHLKELILVALILKVTVFVIIFLAGHLLPFCYHCYVNDLAYLPVQSWTPWLSFGTWDARHYSYLVDMGYMQDFASNAFYPLFPLLVGAVKVFISNTLIAGFLVANAASLVALVLFFLLVKRYFTESIAFYSSIFLLLFPTSFYLSLMYSESLFLALVLAFFYFWEKQSYYLAAMMGFLLSLSRPLGVLIIIPLLAELITTSFKQKGIRQIWSDYAVMILGTIAGFSAYLLFMTLMTGSPWAGFIAQRYFVTENSIYNLIDIGGWLQRNFLTVDWSLHSFTSSILDRLFFLAYLLCLMPIYKKVPKRFFWYSVVMGMVPALSGMFMAYTRYLLMVFPVFILLALLAKNRTPYVAMPLLMLQILFLIMHVLNFWVA